MALCPVQLTNRNFYINVSDPIGFEKLLQEIAEIRHLLMELPQSKEINELMGQSKEIIQLIKASQHSGSPLSIQVSAGFDFFGNGAKIIFDSKNVKTSTIERAKDLINKLSKRNEMISIFANDVKGFLAGNTDGDFEIDALDELDENVQKILEEDDSQ